MGKIDKTKPSHWKNNDTFILKINNGSEYNGRYLILIKYVDAYIRDSGNKHLFRVKITNNKNEPKSLEDIKQAIPIKSFIIDYEYRFDPSYGGESCKEMLERCKHLVNIKPDKYNYLYYYLIWLDFRKNIEISKLKYIGNFNDDSIKEYEHIPTTVYYGMLKIKPNKLIDILVKKYENNNLKKSYDFTKEGNEERRLSAKKFWETKLKAMEDFQKIKNGKIKFDFPYSFGWNYKLYDSDESLDIKLLYEKVYNKNKINVEVMNELIIKGQDYLKDDTVRPRFWMVVADLQMKNKRLDQKLKDFALIAIEDDLMFWKETEYYNQRKKELDKLKKKLEEYQCEN